jgi:hypothetical protein
MIDTAPVADAIMMTFYCSAGHSGRRRGAVILGHLPEGGSAILCCPDVQCRRRYACTVERQGDDGELVTRQVSLKRAHR